MKKFLLWILLVVVIMCISIITAMKLYIPTGSVLLKTAGRAGNQLFQYAAAYSLAKETDSKLYVIVNKKHKDLGYEKSEYALGEFNIPEDNIVYLNKYNRLYMKFIYEYDNFFVNIIKKFLNIEYVDEANFISIAKIQNNKILVMKGFFEAPFYFEKYKDELLKKFTFKNVDTKKLNKIINNISQKKLTCIHVRRGDMVYNGRFTSIEFQKKAIILTKKLINNPEFFVFSDDPEMVKNELGDIKNLKFINGNSAIEDLYLMSKCSNNIITRSSFSWWAAYLNQNKGLVIAPYNLYSEKFFMEINDLKKRVIMRDSYSKSTPNNWILLNESSKFNENSTDIIRNLDIYSGNRIKLSICNNGDFYSNLCFSNN